MRPNGEDWSPGAGSDEGIPANMAGALAYVLGIITGILFVMTSRDPFVRFHAYQSIFLTLAWILFWGAFSIVSVVLGFIPLLGFLVWILGVLLSLILGLGGLALWAMLILRAYQGRRWKLPYIGDLAERYATA